MDRDGTLHMFVRYHMHRKGKGTEHYKCMIDPTPNMQELPRVKSVYILKLSYLISYNLTQEMTQRVQVKDNPIEQGVMHTEYSKFFDLRIHRGSVIWKSC